VTPDAGEPSHQTRDSPHPTSSPQPPGPASCRSTALLADRQDAGPTVQMLPQHPVGRPVAADCVGHGPTYLLNTTFIPRYTSLAIGVGLSAQHYTMWPSSLLTNSSLSSSIIQLSFSRCGGLSMCQVLDSTMVPIERDLSWIRTVPPVTEL
jgi:hypothetical protein